MSIKTYKERLTAEFKNELVERSVSNLIRHKENEFRKVLNDLDSKLGDARLHLALEREKLEDLMFSVELELSSKTLNPLVLLELKNKEKALILSIKDRQKNIITVSDSIDYLQSIKKELFPETK